MTFGITGCYERLTNQPLISKKSLKNAFCFTINKKNDTMDANLISYNNKKSTKQQNSGEIQ